MSYRIAKGMASSTLLALALCLVALLLVGPEEARGETSLSRHSPTAAPRQPLPRIARAVRGADRRPRLLRHRLPPTSSFPPPARAPVAEPDSSFPAALLCPFSHAPRGALAQRAARDEVGAIEALRVQAHLRLGDSAAVLLVGAWGRPPDLRDRGVLREQDRGDLVLLQIQGRRSIPSLLWPGLLRLSHDGGVPHAPPPDDAVGSVVSRRSTMYV